MKLSGCPNCGRDSLEVRDLEDEAWHDLGGELLRELEPEPGLNPPTA